MLALIRTRICSSRYLGHFSSNIISMQQLEQKAISLLKVFQKDENISNHSLERTFSKDLNLDSLDIVEYVMEFESEFNIQIPDKEADNFKSPRDVICFIYNSFAEDNKTI